MASGPEITLVPDFGGGTLFANGTGGGALLTIPVQAQIPVSIRIALGHVRGYTVIYASEFINGAWQVRASQPMNYSGYVPALNFTPTTSQVRLYIGTDMMYISSAQLFWILDVSVERMSLVPELMATTIHNTDKDRYSMGYNGQMKVNEVAGMGNHNTALSWEYGTRLGRRWNTDPEEQEFPALSPYSTNYNNPVISKDAEGEVGFIDNVIGAAVGVLVEAGTQIAVNFATGKKGVEIFDLDYADIAIEAGVGFVTSGVGNLAKLGKVGVRLSTAAQTANRVIESNRVLRTTSKVAKYAGVNGVKAGVDVKLEDDNNTKGKHFAVKVVGDKKSIKNAGIDFVGGKVADGATKAIATVANRGLSGMATRAATKSSRAMLGSTRRSTQAGIARGLNNQIDANTKAAAISTGIGTGAVGEQVKDPEPTETPKPVIHQRGSDHVINPGTY